MGQVANFVKHSRWAKSVHHAVTIRDCGLVLGHPSTACTSIQDIHIPSTQPAKHMVSCNQPLSLITTEITQASGQNACTLNWPKRVLCAVHHAYFCPHSPLLSSPVPNLRVHHPLIALSITSRKAALERDQKLTWAADGMGFCKNLSVTRFKHVQPQNLPTLLVLLVAVFSHQPQHLQ